MTDYLTIHEAAGVIYYVCDVDGRPMGFSDEEDFLDFLGEYSSLKGRVVFHLTGKPPSPESLTLDLEQMVAAADSEMAEKAHNECWECLPDDVQERIDARFEARCQAQTQRP